MSDSASPMTESSTGGCSSACSLPADQLTERVKEIRKDLATKVERREELQDGVLLHFARSATMERELDDFVAFERECCSGIDWKVEADRGAETLRLRVSGEGASELVALFEQGRLAPPRAPGRLQRLARAGGLGVTLALFVCCVVPMAAAAVAGGAATRWLAGLDDPLVITAVGAGFAVTAWFVMDRRARSAA